MPLPSPVLPQLALSLLLSAGAAGQGAGGQTLAQVQKFILGPGSNVGPSTRVVPTNCYKQRSDNSWTCDTKLVNPPGNTPARPSYSPFSN